MFFRFCTAGLAVMTLAGGATAATVDFETLPGGTPSEGTQITNQFEASAGVTFSLLDGSTGTAVSGGPVLAKRGTDGTDNGAVAFTGSGGSDQVISGDQALVGDFFLTDDGLTTGGLNNPILVVQYTTATAGISADILDIDNAESFSIRIYSDLLGASLLDTFSINGGNADTGNGVATQFAFTRTSADVRRIEFEGSVGTGGFFGLGFDNFSTGSVAAIPVPGSLAILLSGLGGFAAMRRTTKA